MERRRLDWPGREPDIRDVPSDVYADPPARRCFSAGCNGAAVSGSRWCADCLSPAAGELFGAADLGAGRRRNDALRDGGR
jgi:hypothetical protein